MKHEVLEMIDKIYKRPECIVVPLAPRTDVLSGSLTGGTNQDFDGEKTYDEGQGWG